MDLIYYNGSNKLSLQSLTTTIIIQKILEDEGMLPNCERDLKKIASRAIEVVNNLPLPLLLKCELRPMVLPIMDEMQSWYQNKDEASQVVLTQNGTVDLPKSIRGMLNNTNISIMQRFKVACDHCLEQGIFDIGAQINFPHNFGSPEPHPASIFCFMCFNNQCHHRRSLAKIWYKIYEGNFRAKLGLKDISEDYCTQGFVHAFYTLNSTGMKYFVEGASPSEISFNFLNTNTSELNDISFTPDAYIKMFKRLNDDERQHLKSDFSAALLKALLKWPYQCQFLKAAESLAKNMDGRDFWSVAARIVKKARYGWKDHHYKGLFVDFWKLGSTHKESYIYSACFAEKIMYNVILTRDERLANFVLDNTNKYFKEEIFNCYNSSVRLRLISEEHFEALELFIEVCRVNNDKLIVKFQKDIQEFLNVYKTNKHIYGFFCPIFIHFKSEERKYLLREFLSRMEKLKPQMSEMSI